MRGHISKVFQKNNEIVLLKDYSNLHLTVIKDSYKHNSA
jgi:hypothetical protein